jgi:3-oxoacyl-[acyl-carrier protein] reductase
MEILPTSPLMSAPIFQSDFMRLNGRIAFVTGSSRGIGAAIAQRLAADGAKLVLHASKDGDRVQETAESIRAGGGSADVVVGDLTSGEVASQIVRDAFAVHGALDILVCNAGAPASGPIVALDAATIDANLSLNMRAVMLSTIEFAKLTRSPYGRVVLISSASAAHPVEGAALYSAAKSGAEAFIRCAAQELGERGITLNAVQPGMTASRAVPAGMAEKVARWTALRRIGAPDDIADIVAFLACDDARWLTGATIPAAGGQITSATNIITKG